MLSRDGDVIAEKTGLGKAWIGLILMSSVASLPELIIGISFVVAGYEDIFRLEKRILDYRKHGVVLDI